jgi:hypothetical protein
MIVNAGKEYTFGVGYTFGAHCIINTASVDNRAKSLRSYKPDTVEKGCIQQLMSTAWPFWHYTSVTT